MPALPMHCGIGANSRNIFSFEDIVVTLCVATFRVKKIVTFCVKKLLHFASKVVTFRVDVTFCVEICYSLCQTLVHFVLKSCYILL